MGGGVNVNKYLTLRTVQNNIIHKFQSLHMKIFSKVAIAALTLSAFVQPAVAQEESTSKANVLIDYFWRPTDISSNVAEELRNYCIQGINDTKRVELIDVDSQSALKIEKDRRDQGVDAEGDMDRIAEMKNVGANFVIQGRITSLAVEKKTNDKGGVYYTAVMNYTLKTIDPTTGKLVHSQSLKYGGGLLDLETSNTADEAVTKACRSAQKEMKAFVSASFPLFGKILDVDQVKKDEIKTCFISIGSDAGVNVKDKFTLNIVREVAGRKSLKEIGECEVKAVEGGDISLVEVKKGGKELKAALDGGQTVAVKSTVQKAGGVKFRI